MLVRIITVLLLPACGNTGGFLDQTSPDTGFGVHDAGVQVDSGTPGAQFSESSIDRLGEQGRGVRLGDIDGDGDIDVVAAYAKSESVRIYLNHDLGDLWVAESVLPVGAMVAVDVELADFDRDLDLDIAVIGQYDPTVGEKSPGEVVWLENPGRVQDEWTRHAITDLSFWAPRSIEAVDLTGDGQPDLVVAASEAEDPNGNPHGNGLHWFRNRGGAFDGPFIIDADLVGATMVVAGDIDRNAVLDLVAVGRGSSEVVWYENGRTRGTTTDDPRLNKHLISRPAQPFSLQLANLDDDREPELVLTITSGQGSVVWLDPPQDPTREWTEHTIDTTVGGGDNARVFAADFDGDLFVDVAVNTAGQDRIDLFYNISHGTTWRRQGIASGYESVGFLTGGNLNGDSRPDLVTSTLSFETGSDLISWWPNRP